MAAPYAHHRQASGQRRASSFQEIIISTLQTDQYPCPATKTVPALADLQRVQATLSNANNFSVISSCGVLEIAEGIGVWHTFSNDASCIVKTQNWAKQSRPQTLIWPLTLLDDDGTNFGRQLSLGGPVAKFVLEQFDISPQFVPFMLGEPDYYGPSGLVTYLPNGDPDTIREWHQDVGKSVLLNRRLWVPAATLEHPQVRYAMEYLHDPQYAATEHDIPDS